MYILKVDDLSNIITNNLQLYSDEVIKKVKKECKNISEELAENIKRDSPNRTGKYLKGWRIKTMYEDKNNIRIRTYNKTRYQLTHLLEYGHVKQNGGRVEGKAHIRPNKDKAKKELNQRIKQSITK